MRAGFPSHVDKLQETILSPVFLVMNPASSTTLRRRTVLGGLLGCAAPLILPARLRGQSAPSGKIHLAMIGCGRQAYHANLPGLLKLPAIRVVAVCDVDRSRAAAAKAKVDDFYGTRDCKTYTDYREALAQDGLDAVMNSTPDHWHALTSLAAIERGLHVCCEKPLTRYLAEGRLIADAAKRKGLVFRTDTECRSSPYMVKLADLALNGYLGTIRRFEVGVPREIAGNLGTAAPQPVPSPLDYELWLGPAPARPYTSDRVHPTDLAGRPGWMRILDYCEGMISNWGTHLLDVAQLINGTERSGPVAVEARGTYPQPGSGLWDVLLDFQAQFRFANGTTCDYRMDTPFLKVIGDDGWVRVAWPGSGGMTAHDRAILKTKFKDSDHRVPARGDKEDFVSAIKDGTPPMADAEIGHRTCSLGQIAHIAIQRGKPLAWDPQTERFPGNPEADKLLAWNYREPWAALMPAT
jgi:myo-inositol 2-dehydrogenase / D-chiro-inositol 1-dehydrogenase